MSDKLRKKYKITPIAYEITTNWRKDFIDGFIDFIAFLKENTEVKTIVEIGSFLGDSTVEFAKKFDIVYSIDPYYQEYDNDDPASYFFDMFDVECNFLKRTESYRNIVKLKMTGSEASHIFNNNSLDLVYIDSDHRYDPTKRELLNWISKIKKNGYISGHDYDNPSHPGVKMAVDEILDKPDMIFSDYSWIKKVV